MQYRRISRGGFALPTVLIASVVMLIVLVVSVSSVAAVRVTLKTQYYEQLAKSAGEAGVAYAKACLAKNGNVPLWTDAKPLRPSTDCAGNSLLTPAVQVLVVAGGGSGGSGTGGGGGGGGVLYSDNVDVSATSYPVVVGGGGSSPPFGTVGNNGANSSVFGMVAIGGGGGAFSNSSSATAPGRNGGSGGGGQNYNGNNLPGSGTLGQGYSGGPLGTQSGGGGGGAGGTGVGGSGQYVGGAGGPGVVYSISGTNVYYAGGGGGAGNTSANSGKPGPGGATAGGEVAANATPNTGGGGGGGWSHAGGRGGAGGSGVVIIRYGNDGSIDATGGAISYSGPYKIHKFTSNGTFNISDAQLASCPSAVRCSVLAYDNIRSSFSVAAPTLDEQGKAVAIPNSGYVELLRDSTGEVWRTYRQPSVQAAVVPDLCSGAASTGLGWSNAIRTAAQDSIPSAPGAVTISLADNTLPAGKMFFRKDFVVSDPGTYDIGILTGSESDSGDVYIDGVFEVNSNGSYATGSVNLSAGCHTITVQLSNQTIVPRRSDFTASIQKNNSAPILVTDTNWRVSAGSSVYFSESDYYADPDIWTGVTDFEMANTIINTWASTTGDPNTRLIAAPCANSCPFSSSTYFRDSKDFIVDANTEVVVSAICDDDCSVYVDGNQVIASSPWSNINQQTITLTAGSHRVGVKLYNSGSVNNPSKFAVVVRDKTNQTVYTRSDIKWLTSNDIWVPGYNVDNDPTSYEASFRPSPAEIIDPPTIDVLVAGGGAGGATNAAGGGGGGGVQFFENVPITVGSKSIVVGDGGAGGANSNTLPGDGGYSQYASTTYRTLGGGNGSPRSNTLLLAGGGNGVHATGGGGAGAVAAAANHPGGTGTSRWQGGNGGAGTLADQGCNSRGGGGGGSGGAGSAGIAAGAGGTGGPGTILYITGTRLAIGGGGAGNGPTCGVSAGYATDGGQSTVSASAAPNSAGGGAAGTGSAGGAGGSGVVIIRFKTGLLSSITTTGSPAISYATIRGVNYTIYTYTTDGTFNPGSINSI